MKANELRSKSVDELKAELEGKLREQFNLRFQHKVGQLNSTDDVRKVRRIEVVRNV